MNPTKFVAVGCAAMMLLLTGCETFAGMGRDMQKAGESVEKAATRNKNKDSEQHDDR